MARDLGSNYGSTFTGAELTPDEVEFAAAMDRYKREKRRPFPSWREVLAVARSLGYTRAGAAGVGRGGDDSTTSPADGGAGGRGHHPAGAPCRATPPQMATPPSRRTPRSDRH